MADTSYDYRAIVCLLYNRRYDAERLDQMRSILEKNGDVVLEQDEDGHTPLHWAARRSSLEYCKLLLEFDPTRESLQLRDSDGWPPLFHACRWNNIEMARYLVQIHPEIINVTDDEGFNCLHVLCVDDDDNHGVTFLEFAGFILEHAPWLISASTEYGDLPLHFACYAGRSLSVLQFLYNLNPEVIYRRNNAGNTPLDAVRERNMYDGDVRDAVITFFRDQLAIINEARTATTPDNRGQLAIHRAMLNANLPVGTLKLIIDENPNSGLIADRLGQTPLCIACRHCNVHVIKYLVEVCEDTLQINDASGELPLHIACRYGKCNVVKWILERSNAGLSVQNREGKIPIQLLLYDANCDRNSLEYMQAVDALLRGHPDAVADLFAGRQLGN